MRTFGLKHIRKNTSGFTLIEILAVTILIAIMAGTAALGINTALKKGKIHTVTGQIAAFDQAISLFEIECSSYPSSLNDLIQKPSQKCKDYPAEGYLKKKEIPLDPWSNEYNYRKPGTHNPSSYDLWSDGPDGQDGTDDDITNWKSDNTQTEE
jgi:general secretion pathway protein G